MAVGVHVCHFLASEMWTDSAPLGLVFWVLNQQSQPARGAKGCQIRAAGAAVERAGRELR
jgi:hypothetical protein